MKRLWEYTGRILYWLTWPLIAVYLYNSHRAYVVLRHNDHIALTRAWLGDGKWSFPGGGMHRRGEAPLSAVRRELKEEVGVTLPAAALHELGSFPFRYRGTQFTCHLFTAEVETMLSLSPQRLEITETSWLSLDQLTIRNAHPLVYTVLQTWSS